MEAKFLSAAELKAAAGDAVGDIPVPYPVDQWFVSGRFADPTGKTGGTYAVWVVNPDVVTDRQPTLITGYSRPLRVPLREPPPTSRPTWWDALPDHA